MTDDARPRWCRTLSLVAVTVVVAMAAATGFVREYSGDFHYHVVVGRWILEHHSPYSGAVQSFTMVGQPFFDSAWIGNVLLAWLFDHGAYVACYGARALCLVATVALPVAVARRDGLTAATGAALGALLIAQSFFVFYLRPEMFAFVCFALIYWLLLGWSDARTNVGRRAVAIYVVQIAWVNLHGSGSFGLLLIGSFVAEEIVRNLRRPRVAARFATFGIGAVIAALANPFGVRAIFAFNVMSATYLQHTTEWYPQPLATLPVVYGFVIAIAFGTTILALRASASRMQYWRIVVAVVLTILAFRYRRFATFSLLAMLPLIAANLGAMCAKWPVRRPVAALRCAVVIVGCVLYWTFERHALREIGTDLDEKSYPLAACNFARSNLPHGHLLNNFDFGSYLMLCLGEPVFIDQRSWSLYPDAFYKEYVDAGMSLDGFRQLLLRYDIGWAFMKYDPLVRGFAANPQRWLLTYFDDQALLYVDRAKNPDAIGMPHLEPANLVALVHASGDELTAATAELDRQLARCPTCLRTGLAELAVAAARRDAARFEHAMTILGAYPLTPEIAFLAGSYAFATGDDRRALAMLQLMEKLGGDPRLAASMLETIRSRSGPK